MCAFDSWLHEQGGYTYHGEAPITGLTQFEVDKLQLGWIVRQEEQAASMERAQSNGSGYSASRKRSHEQSIRQRLKRQ